MADSSAFVVLWGMRGDVTAVASTRTPTEAEVSEEATRALEEASGLHGAIFSSLSDVFVCVCGGFYGMYMYVRYTM